MGVFSESKGMYDGRLEHRVVVGIIRTSEGYVLCGMGDSFVAPQGHVLSRESPLEALDRVVSGQATLYLRNIKVLEEGNGYALLGCAAPRHFYMVYSCLVGGDINGELGWRLVAPKDVPNTPMSVELRYWINRSRDSGRVKRVS